MRSSTHFFLPAGFGFLVLFGCVIICPIFCLIGFGPAPLNVMQKQNIARIAKSCPESLSVVKVSRCFCHDLSFQVLSQFEFCQNLRFWVLSQLEFLSFVTIRKNLKTQIVTKLNNSNCDKTQKLKLWQNSKTETETKHTNFKCDNLQKLKLEQNQKRKLWQNSKLKLWQNSKTQIATKLENSYCDRTKHPSFEKLKNSNIDTTKKIKLWQN